MITSSEGGDSGLITINRIKNKYYVITIALSVSLSAVMFGYSLKEITSIPIQVIIDNYQIQIDKNLLQGLLIAIMPFGGLFGSLIAKLLIKSITRRQGMNLALPFLLLSICLVQFTTAATLFVGRFMQGMCVGYYVSIAPIYLRQISPKELKSVTGTFFSCGKIVGVLLVIVLELIIGEDYWRILLSIPALLGIVQFFLLAFIGSDTPYEWIIRKEKVKAQRIIAKIYVQAQIENVLQQIEYDVRLQNNKTSQFRSFQGSLEKKKQTAFFTAINVCISRHFTGGNSLIITAGLIVSTYDNILGKWTPLIINSIQIIALLAYILYFSHLFGKKRLLILSMGLLALINTMLVVALALGNQIFIMVSIILAMAVYGGMLLSVVWSYPSEILPASESLVPNIMHWLALSLSSLAPSLVISLMPNNQVYPCFVFFAIYCLFGFLFFIRFAVQSNGATYQEIIEKFKEW